MKIIEDKENKLLGRREVKLIIEGKKNPTTQEAAKIVAEHFKSKEDSVAVKLVKGKFGRDTFLIVANLYNSKEVREKIEPKPKKKKGEEEKKEQPAPAEPKTEEKKEKPTEQLAEEKPAEEKKDSTEENKEEAKEQKE